MAKKIIQKPASSALSDWIGQAGDDSVKVKSAPAAKQKPYSEKVAKGRPISMTDAFYDKLKEFSKAHPELRSISEIVVNAVSEFMVRHDNPALAQEAAEQSKKLKEYSEWMEKLEKVFKDRPVG